MPPTRPPQAAPADAPCILLTGDGVPTPVRAALRASGLPLVDAAAASGREVPRILLGTPASVTTHPAAARPGTTRVAVAAPGEAWREGIDYLLRPPVDPEALRLLLVHLLAGGPDRRLERRASLRRPVWLWCGLRPRRGWLCEVSTGGARVELPRPARPGRFGALRLPAEEGARGRWLPVRVLRCTPGAEGHLVSLAFTGLSLAGRERLRRMVETRLATGHEGAADDATGTAERRRDPRRAYRRRVIARGAARPRVLLGRDLSLGGMRVDPDPDLAPGADLQVALHVRPGAIPLVLRGRVERDDGPRGLFVRFVGLDRARRDYLEGMLGALPSLEQGEGRGVVVSEVLTSGEGARPPLGETREGRPGGAGT